MFLKNTLRGKFYLFVGIILSIIILGVAGYMYIEGWSLVDALYMTTITISTVGFSEVNSLSVEGKVFTMFLIIISFGNFAFAISSLTKYVVGGEYRKDLRELREKRNLRNMKDHIIVTGFGRVGRQVTYDLMKTEKHVVVIEQNPVLIEAIEVKDKIQFVQGNATKDDVLHNARIEFASAIVTCLPEDADNLYIVLAAREFNKNIRIVARASKTEAVSKLYMAGASSVVMPDSIGGSHMASIIASPHVADFLEMVSFKGNSEVNVECVQFNDLPEEFKNKKIAALDAKNKTGVSIVGFKSAQGEYIINPNEEIEIVNGSSLFVLGTREQIGKLNIYLGHNG